MNEKRNANITSCTKGLQQHRALGSRVIAFLLFIIFLLSSLSIEIVNAKVTNQDGKEAKAGSEAQVQVSSQETPGNEAPVTSKDTMIDSETAQEPQTGQTDNEKTEEPQLQKKYMIIIANQRGYYTFYEFNDQQDGKASIELTPNDTIMVPLKKLVKLIPELTYRYDSSKKTATVQNTMNGKKVEFKRNNKTLNYYSGPKAKASKKTMDYKMYVSEHTASVMVPMNTLKWLFQTSKGYGYYDTLEMQKYGYDTLEYSGLIVYQPYQAISSIPKAANVTGISLTVKVTIPEGYAVTQIFDLLVKKGVCASTEELYEVMENYDFSNYPMMAELKDSDNRCYRLEGYLFPDTYEFYRLSKPENILIKFLTNSEMKLAKEYREKAKELGLSIDELLTIASLVEKETSDPKLMPVVASVIYNRLGINMKLQLDCTDFYLIRYVRPFISGDINRYDLFYDTYQCPALPEGPIANPGMAAIRAALSPADTDYLFFYSDKQGEYHFSVEYVNLRLLEQESEQQEAEQQEGEQQDAE